VLSSVQCLKKLCSTELTLVLLGDFNLPLIEWTFYHAIDNIIYNTFFRFYFYGLLQFVNVPTRGDNILDLVLSTSSSFPCDDSAPLLHVL